MGVIDAESKDRDCGEVICARWCELGRETERRTVEKQPRAAFDRQTKG